MATADLKAKVDVQVTGYDGAGFWQRFVRGLFMEPKDGGGWHGSTGRVAFWTFLAMCAAYQGVVGEVPSWCETGLWSAFAYCTTTKLKDAIIAFKKT
ncbi:hypothetical protein LCGC14_1686250 [marine sediment metagenome]|uniref:Uncharacterized protein n=1 Tax=marine sediment metagenome TaxID=412755 RepID=A0A0F9HM66_9ZZZZ